MKLVIYSRTPLAAAPWELWKAIKKYTLIDAVLINERFRYPDGRTFPYHLLMSMNGTASQALKQTSLWHVHNYLTQSLISLHNNQKILAQFHSVPRLGNWHQLMKKADRSYTIDQPLQKKEYKLPALPNIIDPDEYRPGPRGKTITIAFAPTNKLPPGHPASKGYFEIRRILSSLALEKPVEIIWIEGKPYLENLKLKSKAHILIDDVITGNWHRTSLEGACFGCAILNKSQKYPFVQASPKNLKEKLIWLIEHPSTLKDIQERTRLWVLQEWHAMDRIQEYKKAYKELAGCM